MRPRKHIERDILHRINQPTIPILFEILLDIREKLEELRKDLKKK